MATIKLTLDKSYKPRNLKPNEIQYPLVLKVSHRRVAKNIPTGKRLLLSQWNEDKRTVRKSYPNSGRANSQLARMYSTALAVVEELGKAQLKEMTVYHLVDVIEAALGEQSDKQVRKLVNAADGEPLTRKVTTLKSYGNMLIKRLESAGKHATAANYLNCLKGFHRFHGSDYLPLKQVSKRFLDDYEAWYLGKGNSVNGMFTGLKDLRTILNKAIDDPETELSPNDYPFGNGPTRYKIRYEETRKRSVDMEQIDQLRSLPLTPGTKSWNSRNYFLFMLNMRGMSFKDFCTLTYEENLEGDRILYRRTKTKHRAKSKLLVIKMSPEAQEIFNYYDSLNEEKKGFIFPLLRDLDPTDSKAIFLQVRNMTVQINTALRKLGKELGIDLKMTTYVARHTFATAGKKKGLPIAKISELLGHKDQRTTEIYLGSFDREDLDEATALILG